MTWKDLSPQSLTMKLPPASPIAALLINGGWVRDDDRMTEDLVCTTLVLGDPRRIRLASIDRKYAAQFDDSHQMLLERVFEKWLGSDPKASIDSQTDPPDQPCPAFSIRSKGSNTT